MSSLFRKEVLDKKRGNIEGNILLSVPLSLTLTVSGFIVFVLLAFFMAFNFEYAEKRTLTGQVRMSPDQAKVSSDQKGNISSLYVENKDKVSKGDVLALIRYEQTNEKGEDVSLKSIALLESSLSSSKQKNETDKKEVSLRIAALENEKTLTVDKIASQDRKLVLVNRQRWLESQSLNRFKKAYEAKSISKVDFDNYKKAFVRVEREVEQEKAAMIALKQRQYDIDSQIAQLTLQNEKLDLQIQKESRDIEERISNIRYGYESSLVAPISGSISGLIKFQGEVLLKNQTLLTLIPDNADLYVDLLSPSSLSSVISLGDEVKVYVSAYPYQENGFITANVSAINPSIIMPNDTNHNMQVREPSYLISLKLTNMTTSVGKELELRSGMAVSADVITRKQKVIDWIFKPLNNIKEKY